MSCIQTFTHIITDCNNTITFLGSLSKQYENMLTLIIPISEILLATLI